MQSNKVAQSALECRRDLKGYRCVDAGFLREKTLCTCTYLHRATLDTLSPLTLGSLCGIW